MLDVRPGFIVRLLVVYTAWFITTPYNSPRLTFLATIQFERILAAGTLTAILLRARRPNIRFAVVGLVLGFFLLMVVSNSLSPHSQIQRCVHWHNNYWKMIVYFLFVVFGLGQLEDLSFLFRWTVYVTLFYQLLSWRDFLAGGSYVYQQGIKRICGTWSGGSLGAANAFGSMSVIVLPFAVFLYQTGWNRRMRLLAVSSIILSCLSIIYSGTRGALITALLYGMLAARRWLWTFKGLVTLLSICVIVVMLAPDDLKNRYLSSFGFLLGQKAESRSEQTAKNSAESRVDGLMDGLALGSKRPFLGYGPEASPRARRLEIRATSDNDDLALHNLYGQVIAELGWGGFAVWLCLLQKSIGGLVGLQRSCQELASEHQRVVMAMRQLLLHSLLIMLFYGLASHSLYEFEWLLIFGCQIALVSLVEDAQRDGAGFVATVSPV